MTISDCLDRFKEYLRVTRGFSSGTVKRYSRCLERFEEFLSLRGGEGERTFWRSLPSISRIG